MSDSVTWFVDLDASLDDAKELAEQVKAWLIAQGIVSSISCQAVGGSHLLSRGKSAAMWEDNRVRLDIPSSAMALPQYVDSDPIYVWTTPTLVDPFTRRPTGGQ